MELKTDDVISMINDHNEKVEKEIERAAKKENRAAELKKQELKKKRVLATVIFTAGLAIGAIGNDRVKPYFEGQDEIVKEFNDAIEDYGIYNHSEGYQINNKTTLVEFDYGVNSLISAARKEGMNDIEIAIGLNSYFPNETTNKYIDTTFKERYAECVKKYHETEMLRTEEKENEGNVRVNGK